MMPFPLRADIEYIEKQVWKWPYALLIAAWVKFPMLTFSITHIKYLIDNNWDFPNKYEMSGRFEDPYTLYSSRTLLTLASSPHSHTLLKSSPSSLRMSSEQCCCFSQFPQITFYYFCGSLALMCFSLQESVYFFFREPPSGYWIPLHQLGVKYKTHIWHYLSRDSYKVSVL